MDPEHLKGLPSGLAQVLNCLAAVVADVSTILRSAGAAQAGTHNAFGDSQLEVDVLVDNLIFERLAACNAVEAACSEEQPDLRRLPGSGYTVAFDPLDGSSILGANFAVGTIFGVWAGSNPVGCSGRQQCAAVYAVYGPQTILVWARPRVGESAEHAIGAGAGEHGSAAGAGQAAQGTEAAGPNTSTHDVQEFGLHEATHTWQLRRSNVTIAPTSTIFAPANLRAVAGNKAYAALVQRWIEAAHTLRYTGGMVPDVHHTLAKGHGVFCNPCSESAPAKLRLLFECAPLAYIVEAAGGSSTTGGCSVLDVTICTTNERSKICAGSKQMVEEAEEAMRAA